MTDSRQDQRTAIIIAGQLVLGGAERQLYLWLSHLDRDRFRPVLVTLHPDCNDYWEGPIASLGVEIVRVARHKNKLSRLRAVCRAVESHRPALIHGWHLFSSPYAGVCARLVRARASLGSFRGSFRAYADSRLKSALTDLFVDGLVVNSAVVAQKIEGARRLPRRPVFAVPNAVEPITANRQVARRRFGELWNIPEGRTWIGSVGRFEESKRFDVLLEVTASLVRRGEEVHLILMGYGDEAERLKRTATISGIDSRVTITGELADARIWIQVLDVFAFTSVDEGLPNVVMEAAAAGVPIVAWKTDFVRELFDVEDAAVLVEAGNVRAFEEGLTALIRNRECRLGLAERAQREILTRFGVSSFVNRMSGAYEMVLSLGRDGGA
jgi:glycosyltransferase involved in cell wall biosynthesis